MEYKFRKRNRESRDRSVRMIARKRSTMPHMDRERRDSLAERYPHTGYAMRYGCEGLSCSLCAPTVHGKLNRQTSEARAALEQVRNVEYLADNIMSDDIGMSFLESENM